MKTVIITFILILFPLSSFAASTDVTIIHTNDLHSHLLGFSPAIDYTPQTLNDDKTVGGWARIATFIKKVKNARSNPVYVVDAGDFLMGTLFHITVRETGFELNLLKKMGVDITTIGNHEFDVRPYGLARILTAAIKNGGIPEILNANTIFSHESDEDNGLEKFFLNKTIKPYAIKDQNGIKVGFFGLMGRDAAEVAPFAKPLTFRDPIEVARNMVQILREKEQVDVVVMLSHCGIWEKESISEDEIIAKEVPGIDIIVSGHTPQQLDEPLNVNDTLILHTGVHGTHVGVLDISIQNGRVKMVDYKLAPIDDSIPADPDIQERIDDYMGYIDKNVLKKENLSFNKVIARTDFDLWEVPAESNMGDLVTDSLRWYVDKHEADFSDPSTRVDFAVETNGCIRSNLLVGKTGNLTVGDVFSVFPLGIGKDDTMCYPLVSFYIYGWELKDTMEILTSVAPIKGNNFILQVSGLKFIYNPNRMIFDRVMEIHIGDEKIGYKPLDYSKKNRKLYKVAVNIYNATLLSLVKKFTKGILEITPKDKEGNPIGDLKLARVDKDKNQPGVQELKEWLGIMKFLQFFPDKDGDGISDVPNRYRTPQGRIIKASSWNPVNLMSHASGITWMAFTVLVIIVGVICWIAVFVYKKIKA